MAGFMSLLPASCKKLLNEMSDKYGLTVECIVADILLGNFDEENRVFEVSFPEKIGLT